MNRCYICGNATNMPPLSACTNSTYCCKSCLIHEVRAEAINEAWIETNQAPWHDETQKKGTWAEWVMTMDAYENLG